MKSYTKPEIAFVNFGNRNDIGTAGACKIRGNSSDENSCNYEVFPNYFLFLEITASKCNVRPQDGEFGKFCYDVPLADTRIFHS